MEVSSQPQPLIRFDLKRIRDGQEATLLAVDLAMLGLLLINFVWLIFDWLFASTWFAGLVAGVSSSFHDWYAATVHPNFLQIDLVFVSIFLTEFVVRWIVAVRRKTYLRWYFYPFIHWYELLGSLPLAGFRALRFLRILSMIYRLNRLGIINLRGTRIAGFFGSYYNIFVEEVSDRVVLNVLDGVQAELRSGQPLLRQILDDVILTRKPQIVEQLGVRLEGILAAHYDVNRVAIAAYIDESINRAVVNSTDIERLKSIPVFGNYGAKVLERTITQIVFGVVDGAAADLESADNRAVIEEVVAAVIDAFLAETEDLDDVIDEMLLDAIDLVKEKVRVQRWREQFLPAEEMPT